MTMRCPQVHRNVFVIAFICPFFERSPYRNLNIIHHISNQWSQRQIIRAEDFFFERVY